MAEAFIVDAVRTPTGKGGGALAEHHAADLAAIPIKALLERTGVSPDAVEDVQLGCVNQIGPQTSCVARTAWLSAGLPEHVPGVTVDRRCGSSLQAAQFAATTVIAGVADLVVAGGVESMSVVPLGSPRRASVEGKSEPLPGPFDGDGWRGRYGGVDPSQFRGADMIAEEWGFDRDRLEDLAEASHTRAAEAWDAGRFDAEVCATPGLERDEGIRYPVDREKMATLKPLAEGGTITPALSSQISDGAAALLIASERAVEQHELEPLARIHTMTVVGDDPMIMLTAPVPATRKAFERSGLGPSDFDVVEINEAFASVVALCEQELGFDRDQVNVNGGAMALGHPLGATGSKLLTTLTHELRRRNGRYGLVTLCEAGGQANTMIVERV
ncbi:MAG: acetyl-CoA C-acyltransferase [Gaiellaceae bacterium]